MFRNFIGTMFYAFLIVSLAAVAKHLIAVSELRLALSISDRHTPEFDRVQSFLGILLEFSALLRGSSVLIAFLYTGFRYPEFRRAQFGLTWLIAVLLPTSLVWEQTVPRSLLWAYIIWTPVAFVLAVACFEVARRSRRADS